MMAHVSSAEIQNLLTRFGNLVTTPVGDVIEQFPPDEYIINEIDTIPGARQMTTHEFMLFIRGMQVENTPDIINGNVFEPWSLFTFFGVMDNLYPKRQ